MKIKEISSPKSVKGFVDSNMTVPAPKAPYPYFGSKSAVAAEVWARFGDVGHFVDPFLGSAAVPLARPDGVAEVMTLNDLDGLLTNFWRAAAVDSDGLAELCDWPVSELDLHARRRVLHEKTDGITDRLRTDPDFYDLKAAAWWVWGLSQWIGGGFMTGGNFTNTGRRPHLSTPSGILTHNQGKRIKDRFDEIKAALSGARICCGHWRRVVTPAVLFSHGNKRPVGLFLDPPYAGERDNRIYLHDSMEIAHEVSLWAVEAAGRYPQLRIALCDYAGTHDMPGWTIFRWSASAGMSNLARNNINTNRHRETIWFSPSCLAGNQQMDLFSEKSA